MQEQRETSVRFLVQMMINMYVCKKGQDIIAANTMKNDKITFKSYLTFITLAVILIGLNQSAYFFFKNYNLYEKVGVQRKLSLMEMKKIQEIRRIQYYSINSLTPIVSETQFDQIFGVLTHPARRLSYDSFGYSDVEYAWAFKHPSFIFQIIMQSSVFFLMCTFLSMMNKKKEDIKQAFKIQIFTMIVLFIWQVDLIISTESKLHNFQPDFLDHIYKTFPMYERRQMLKVILFPCMNLVDIFVRFLIISKSQKTLLKYGSIDSLKKQTNAVYESVANIQMNGQAEDRVNLILEQSKNKQTAQVYKIQRQLLKRVLFVEGQEIMLRPQINRLLKYFKLR